MAACNQRLLDANKRLGEAKSAYNEVVESEQANCKHTLVLIDNHYGGERVCVYCGLFENQELYHSYKYKQLKEEGERVLVLPRLESIRKFVVSKTS